jgi:phage-related protein
VANFPELDKKPDVSLVQSYNDSTISSAMETGLEITRARFPRVRREWQVSYRNVLQSDSDALDAFIRTAVYGTAGSFTWTHPKTGEKVLVRFSQLPALAEAGYIVNSKLIAAGADPVQAQGFSDSFTFKVREV